MVNKIKYLLMQKQRIVKKATSWRMRHNLHMHKLLHTSTHTYVHTNPAAHLL